MMDRCIQSSGHGRTFGIPPEYSIPLRDDDSAYFVFLRATTNRNQRQQVPARRDRPSLSSDFGSFNLLIHGELLDACAEKGGRGEENFSFWDPAGFGMTIGAVTKQEKKTRALGSSPRPE